jgi:hypothetical protein
MIDPPRPAARLSKLAVVSMAVVTIAIALWLGSLAHTLLSVWSLFDAHPRAQSDVAVRAAPVIFYITERANVVVGLIGIVAAMVWSFTSRAARLRWLIGALVVALLLSIAQTLLISTRMDALRESGLGGGPEFMKLHGIANVQYLVQLLLLLVSAAALPWVIRSSHGTRPADPSA